MEVTLTFSQTVQVDTAGGTPSLPVLLSGTASRQAVYLRGSRTGQLVFGYTLNDVDGTHSSLLLAPNSLALNGGTIKDVANNLDAAIDHQGAGAFFIPQDVSAPELRSATVDGSSLTLTFDEELDNSVTLSSGPFAVNVNGVARTVLGVAVGQSSAVLLLSPAVEAGDTVTLDYTVPTEETAARLQDLAGNAAASFSGQEVTNQTAAPSIERSDPVQAPTSLEVAVHESGKLGASWDAPASGPTPTGYTVQWKESGAGWDDANDVSEAGVKVTSHVITGLTDWTEYTVRVIARSGDANSTPSAEVTATPRETVPPASTAAAVDAGALTLTYDEDLDTDITPPTSAFAVNVNGWPRSIDSVSVSGTTVMLTLATAVEASDTVTVSYTAPTGESANKLQDASGNAAESFSGQEVTNNTASSNMTRSEPVQAPASPTNLEVARHESGKLRASWTAPESGPTPTGYTVQWKESADGWANPDHVSEAHVTGTSHIITGLTDGTAYSVRVISTTDNADSDPSDEVLATAQETVPPAPSAATVDGATLAITFGEPLDAGRTPDKSAFSVTVVGSSRGVDTAAVSGSVVTLTLVTAVIAGDTVTVDYTAPADAAANRLQDLAGNAAASFSGQQVANATQPAQVEPPALPAKPGGGPPRERQAQGILDRLRVRPESHRIHHPVEGVGGRLGQPG